MKKNFLLLIIFLSIYAFSDNIYFGQGQQIVTFEEAFEIAQTGDHLIQSRVDTIIFEKGYKWLSFPSLDVVLDDEDIAENVLDDV
ncbi:MAG: hypothetical protein DRI23_09755, partial [Candidatus Cloacimonadota bacterium]